MHINTPFSSLFTYYFKSFFFRKYGILLSITRDTYFKGEIKVWEKLSTTLKVRLISNFFQELITKPPSYLLSHFILQICRMQKLLGYFLLF